MQQPDKTQSCKPTLLQFGHVHDALGTLLYEKNSMSMKTHRKSSWKKGTSYKLLFLKDPQHLP